MVFSAAMIIAALSRIWDLQPGDLVFTDTPKGAGALTVGDTVTISADWAGTDAWKIV